MILMTYRLLSQSTHSKYEDITVVLMNSSYVDKTEHAEVPYTKTQITILERNPTLYRKSEY
jgi:hypothetical protein